MNILVDRLLSVCAQTVERDIGQQKFLCTICAQIINRTFVHKRLTNICTQILNRTFVHKRLTNILVDRLQTVFCQIFRLTVCSPFFAQTVDRYIGTKRKRKFNENQENNTSAECTQLSQEKKAIHWTAKS